MKDINSIAIVGGVKAPFTKKTYDHYCEAIKENDDNIIKALLGSYTTNDLIILWGCSISATIPGDSSLTEGAIYYNGEVYPVDANATITTTSGQTLVWEVVTTYADGDPVKYSDGNLKSQHRIKKMRLRGASSGTGIANYDSSTVKRWQDLRRGEYLTSPITLPSGVSSYPLTPIKVKKDITGRVFLKGALQGAPSSGSIFMILAAGYRPTQIWNGNVMQYSNDGSGLKYNPVKLAIDTTGELSITFIDGSATPGGVTYLDCVSFDTY